MSALYSGVADFGTATAYIGAAIGTVVVAILLYASYELRQYATVSAKVTYVGAPVPATKGSPAGTPVSLAYSFGKAPQAKTIVWTGPAPAVGAVVTAYAYAAAPGYPRQHKPGGNAWVLDAIAAGVALVTWGNLYMARSSKMYAAATGTVGAINLARDVF